MSEEFNEFEEGGEFDDFGFNNADGLDEDNESFVEDEFEEIIEEDEKEIPEQQKEVKLSENVIQEIQTLSSSSSKSSSSSSREEKEIYKYTHKTHVLYLLYRLQLRSMFCDSSFLQGLLLSLVSNDIYQLSRRNLSIKSLTKLLDWFHLQITHQQDSLNCLSLCSTFQANHKDDNDIEQEEEPPHISNSPSLYVRAVYARWSRCTRKQLQAALYHRQASTEMFVMLFVILVI